MDIKEIKISELVKNNIDIKENCFTANRKLKQSLNDYGQIYPVLIRNNSLEIIKGLNIVKAMKELNWKKVLVKEVIINNNIELLKFKYLLNKTQDDINVLKLGLVIQELNKKHDINYISEKSGINIEQLVNYIDLLKLNNLIQERKEANQPKLF